MKISVFTSTNASLTKRFEVVDGVIEKIAQANFYSGTAETRAAATPAELLALMEGLTPLQALSAGILKAGTKARITTANAVREGGTSVARSLKYFHFPEGPGWLLWDYDNGTMPPEVSVRVEALGGPLAALLHIWPEAMASPYLIRPSASGGVSAPGIPEKQSEGLHGYFLIDDVSRSSEALEVLLARAWAAGLAWCALSKSGAVLVRSIVDAAVGSPERLIFEAAPILIDPVVRAPKPAILSGGVVPVAVPSIDDARAAAAKAAEAEARHAIQPEAVRVEAEFIEDRAQVAAKTTGKPIEEARRMVRQMLRGASLSDDHQLQMRGGSYMRVGDLLDAPERYNRLSLPDPIEGLSYGPDKATLLLLPNPSLPDMQPRLVSHAHGMTTVYRFQRYEVAQPARGRAGQFTGVGAVAVAAPALPVFTPTAGVGLAISSGVGGWIGRAQAGTPKGAAPPVLALAASPGAGKSRVARDIIAQADLSAQGGDVVWHAPTLALCDEAAAHAIALGSGGHVTRGRSAINPATGRPMCSRSAVAEAVALAGLPVFSTLCAQPQPMQRDASGEPRRVPPILCPEYARCAHVNQWSELGAGPVLRFEPSAYLRLSGDGSDRDVAMRVIDESFWPGLIGVVDLTREDWLCPRTVPRGTAPEDRADAQRIVSALPTAAMEVWRALEQGDFTLLDNITADQFGEYEEFENPKSRLASTPEHSDREILNELKVSRRLDQKSKARSRVWAILRDCRLRGVRAPQRVRITRQPIPGTDEHAFRDVLRVCWREDFPQDVPTLLLDADITKPFLDAIFHSAELMEVRLQANARTIQVADQNLSKTALRGAEKRKEAASLIRAEVYRDFFTGQSGVLVGAARDIVVRMFEDAGFDFAGKGRAEVNTIMRSTTLHGARWLWFGPGSLGLNAYEDFGTAVILGREELPLQALQDEARSLFGDRGVPLDLIAEVKGANYPEALLPYLMRDGSGLGVKVRLHPDERVRALQEQHRERGTIQLIERLRLGRAFYPKRVVVACKVPLPGLFVDELVHWADLIPSRLDQAIAEAAQRGGCLRLSAAGLAADAPETFGSVASAELWLRREGKDALDELKYRRAGNSTLISRVTVFDPRPFDLRLQGQRGKITPAIAVLPGRIRQMAEAQYGAISEVREPPLPEGHFTLGNPDGIIDLNLAPTGRWTEDGKDDTPDDSTAGACETQPCEQAENTAARARRPDGGADGDNARVRGAITAQALPRPPTAAVIVALPLRPDIELSWPADASDEDDFRVAPRMSIYGAELLIFRREPAGQVWDRARRQALWTGADHPREAAGAA